ncbi:MAG: hypothetical protein WC742_11050 [Gallionellaceae bacterium]|jgi:hypothetical protein
MSYALSISVLLLIGAAILITGILTIREEDQSLLSALYDSIVWGLGFLISFGTEFWLLAKM